VAQEFIKIIDGQSVNKCSINDGVNVMRIIEACRLSSNEEREVTLNEIQNKQS